jgi:CopG antitoxin of type II toxin-antitoxin system
MRKSSRKREPIPDSFKGVAEAAEFWDTHDLSEYWDLTRETSFEVDLQRHLFLTALEPDLAKRLVACARKQGVSTETLINVWLAEKLMAASKND